MRKLLRHYILLATLALTPLVVLAADIPIPDTKTIQENPHFFQWVVAVSLALALIYVGRHIYQSDQNNKKQWENIDQNRKDISGVRIDVAKLQTAHDINHGGANDPHFRRSQPREEGRDQR
jgi:hypothetical protein